MKRVYISWVDGAVGEVSFEIYKSEYNPVPLNPGTHLAFYQPAYNPVGWIATSTDDATPGLRAESSNSPNTDTTGEIFEISYEENVTGKTYYYAVVAKAVEDPYAYPVTYIESEATTSEGFSV